MKNVSLWLVTCACSGAMAFAGSAVAQDLPGGGVRGSGSVQQGGGNAQGGGSIQRRGNAGGERGQGGIRGRGQADGEAQRGENPSRGRASGQLEGEINRGRSPEGRQQREMPNRSGEARESIQRSQEEAQRRSDSARESIEQRRENAREGMEQRRDSARESLEQRREQMQRGDGPTERRSFRNPEALDDAQRRGENAAERGENAAENARERAADAANNAENRANRGADRLRNYLSGNRGDQRDSDNRDPENRENVRERGEGDRFDARRPNEERDNDLAEERREMREDLQDRADRLRGAQFRRWDNLDQVADRVRANLRSNNRYRGPSFDQNFWQSQVRDYRGRGYYHVRGGRNYDNRYWWNPTPWDRLVGWVSFRFNEPYYYTYGPGGDVYYRDGYVFVRGNRYATVPEYYQQAVRVVRSVDVSEQEAQSMEWQPLGVFALTADESNEPSLIVQLAVNKEGILSGTFYDEQTQESRPLIGRVDQESQRAVWHFADAEGTGIVMETTFANLSKEETSVLVHFGPEETESWLLVRLPAPEQN